MFTSLLVLVLVLIIVLILMLIIVLIRLLLETKAAAKAKDVVVMGQPIPAHPVFREVSGHGGPDQGADEALYRMHERR